MRKSQRERRRSTDHLPGRIVPRPVARALELLVHRVPWDNASEVSAHCIDPVRFKRVVRRDHKVSRVTLKTLRQRTPRRRVVLDPLLDDDIIPEGILRNLAAAATTSDLWNEEGGVWESQSSDW